LKAVEVEEDDREGDLVALAALDLAADVEVQLARVEELRQVVGDRELLVFWNRMAFSMEMAQAPRGSGASAGRRA
jgi:hypothetical protein